MAPPPAKASLREALLWRASERGLQYSRVMGGEGIFKRAQRSNGVRVWKNITTGACVGALGASARTEDGWYRWEVTNQWVQWNSGACLDKEPPLSNAATAEAVRKHLLEAESWERP